MRLGLDRVWLFLALALPALAALIAPLPAVDLAYQVRAGDLILATGQIPSNDTFTFTVAGAPWLDQQWLAQVLLAAGYRLGGWEALAVLRALMVAMTFGLVAAVAIAARRLTADGVDPRPAHLRDLVAGPRVAAAAVRDRHLRRPAPARCRSRSASPAGWCWCRSWPVPGRTSTAASSWCRCCWDTRGSDDVVRHRPARRSLAVLVAGTVATVVTPFGPGVWAYAVGIGADPQIAAQVSEWQRTTPFTVPGLLFYVSAVAAARRGRVAASAAEPRRLAVARRAAA